MVLVKIFQFSFSLFFFKIGLNILFDYLQKRKQLFLDSKNNLIKTSKNCDFFVVLVKIFKFSFCLFFFKIGLNVLFDYLQERKQPFPDYKNDIRRKSKNWAFCKGVNAWFWSKFSNFLSVCFS